MSDNPQTNQPKKRVPLGKAIQWSDEDLDRLSQVTPEDIELAKGTIAQASPLLGAILNSQTEEDEEA